MSSVRAGVAVWRGPTLLVLAVIALGGCLYRVTPEYIFSASGQVVDEAGTPIRGATVGLYLHASGVYDAIEPVVTSHTVTSESGEFRFSYTSHSPNPPYSLVVRKEGYTLGLVEGAIQEMNPHRIVLSRVTGRIPEPVPIPAPPNLPLQRTHCVRR